MIDWSARIDELADALRRYHAVEDRLAIEVLLSALINCPRTPAVWMILETNWWARDCEDAWFSFGQTWVPNSLERIRARSPWREIEAEMMTWMESPSEERLFIEPDYEHYPLFSRLTQGQFILQRSLRVRMRAARAYQPLESLDTREEERRTDELATLTSAVIEDRLKTRSADPPVFIRPPEFLCHMELLQRLSPWYHDWRSLVRAFGALAVRRAYLHGRAETNAEDNAAIARVAADCVPPWIVKALMHLMPRPGKSQSVQTVMGLEEQTRRSLYGAHRELMRLRRGGIIYWNRMKMHWELVESHRENVTAMLEGRAFGALASCA